MNSTTTAAIARHIISAVGGALVAKGYATDQEAELLAGAVATLVALAFSIAQKHRAAKLTKAS